MSASGPGGTGAESGRDASGGHEDMLEDVILLPDLAHPHGPARLGQRERDALEAHAAAYALDALDPDERDVFQVHLDTCHYCRALVREFAEVVGHLPDAVPPVQATPALRQRLMAAVQEDVARGAAAEADGGLATDPTGNVASGRTPRAAPAGWLERLLGGGQAPRWAAAALLTASVALAIGNVSLLRRTHEEQTRAAAYEAALEAAASGRVVPLASTDGSPRGRVALIAPGPESADRRARLLVAGLPEPPADRTYQLWLIRDGTPHGAGTFSGTGGVATIPVEGDPARAQVVAVTVEPRGGSRAPTSNPILAARL